MPKRREDLAGLSDEEKRKAINAERRAKYLDKNARAYVVRAVEEHGPLIREEIGGVIGVRWTAANRDGARLRSDFCETALRKEELRLAHAGANGDIYEVAPA